MVADMAADMEVHMVADMEVDKVADMVDDKKNCQTLSWKMDILGEIGHFGACRKWPKSYTGTDFSAPNHHGGHQQWSR